VRIVYSKGTIISAEVALGYGVGRHRIEPLLLEAAEHAGLEDPFVWIMDLKDHVVVYRIAGLLENVKGLMSVRSKLRACVLDTLHAKGIEIASPSLMIQRRGTLEDVELPKSPPPPPPPPSEDSHVEDRLFDKAEEAARLGELNAERDRLKDRLSQIKSGKDPETGDALPDGEAERVQAQLAETERLLEEAEAAREAAKKDTKSDDAEGASGPT
ncbi:MAG: hypothetical protein AAFX05_12305, partial [Planctomycetota bacterium]